MIFSDGDEFLWIETLEEKPALRISNKVKLARQAGNLHHALIYHELKSRPLSSRSKLHFTVLLQISSSFHHYWFPLASYVPSQALANVPGGLNSPPSTLINNVFNPVFCRHGFFSCPSQRTLNGRTIQQNVNLRRSTKLWLRNHKAA